MEKKNKNIFVFCFWALIVFVIYSLINVSINFSKNFYINNFQFINHDISINIELDKNVKVRPLVCFNDFCTTLEKNFSSPIHNYKFDSSNKAFFEGSVKKILVALPENVLDKIKIKNLNIEIGNKIKTYKTQDIEKFKSGTISIQLENEDAKANFKAYKLPDSSNYKGIFAHVKIVLMFILSNWNIFIPQYFALFFAILIFIFNKDDFKFKFNLENKTIYILLFLITILGIFLRVVDINNVPLLLDELQTKTIALDGFKEYLQNGFNPPLFYSLEFIFVKIFGSSNIALRILPILFSILSLGVIFAIFKNIDRKLALFSIFLLAINSYHIFQSQMANKFSFCFLLGVISIYFTFEYLKSSNKKNLIFLTITTICLLNTDIHLIFLAISNLIWIFTDLLEKKDYKQIKFFSISQIISFLTIAPYLAFTITHANKIEYNGWKLFLDNELFKNVINHYFINKYFFIALCVILLINLIACYLPEKLIEKINLTKDKEKEKLLIYLTYTSTLILIFSTYFTATTQQIFDINDLSSIYSIIFLITIICFSTCFKIKNFNKISYILKGTYIFLLVGTFMFITTKIPKEHLSIDELMDYVEKDSVQYEKTHEIHVLIPTKKYLLKPYQKLFENKKIIWHEHDINKQLKKITKNSVVKNKNSAVVYFGSIATDFEMITAFNPNFKRNYSNYLDSAKIIYNKE